MQKVPENSEAQGALHNCGSSACNLFHGTFPVCRTSGWLPDFFWKTCGPRMWQCVVCGKCSDIRWQPSHSHCYEIFKSQSHSYLLKLWYFENLYAWNFEALFCIDAACCPRRILLHSWKNFRICIKYIKNVMMPDKYYLPI